MTTNYRRGRDFEYKTVKYLKDMGFPLVVRSAGSKGLIDVVGIDESGYMLVSCKRDGYWPKDERKKLEGLAKALGSSCNIRLAFLNECGRFRVKGLWE